MKKNINPGFDLATVATYQSEMEAVNKVYLPVDEEDNSDEYFHFCFIGKHENVPVIYDAVLTTLRLEHESELYELAEQRAIEHFPNYQKIEFEEDENGDLKELNSQEEEVGLYLAEMILELQEEGVVKVQEHVDIDLEADFGICIDAGLHVEKITSPVIEKFVRDFNEGNLQLDDTFYSFQADDEEE